MTWGDGEKTLQGSVPPWTPTCRAGQPLRAATRQPPSGRPSVHCGGEGSAARAPCTLPVARYTRRSLTIGDWQSTAVRTRFSRCLSLTKKKKTTQRTQKSHSLRTACRGAVPQGGSVSWSLDQLERTEEYGTVLGLVNVLSFTMMQTFQRATLGKRWHSTDMKLAYAQNTTP